MHAFSLQEAPFIFIVLTTELVKEGLFFTFLSHYANQGTKISTELTPIKSRQIHLRNGPIEIKGILTVKNIFKNTSEGMKIYSLIGDQKDRSSLWIYTYSASDMYIRRAFIEMAI